MQTWYTALVGLPTHNLIINSQLATQSKKRVALFPEIGRVKKFLSSTRLYCRMCIRIYIFHS